MNRRVFLGGVVILPFVGRVTDLEGGINYNKDRSAKNLIGKLIHYPYYGGGDRPMIFATHRVVEVNERWMRVDRPGDRQAWVYLNKDVSVVRE